MTCVEICSRWYCCCLCRCDGVPFGTRCLELCSRQCFAYAGLAGHGGAAQFRRKRWDKIERLNAAPARENERGVASHDIVVPDTDVSARIYGPSSSWSFGTTTIIESQPTAQGHGTNHGTESQTSLPTSPPYTLLFLHGGGFVIGSARAKTHHELVCALVRRLGCRAVSVEYRLAPEHPFPAGLNDAHDVLSWVTSGKAAVEHNLPSNVVVCGDSAGGNLALVLALLEARNLDADLQPAKAVDEPNEGRIVHQLLIYPALFESKLAKEENVEEASPTSERDRSDQSSSSSISSVCRDLCVVDQVDDDRTCSSCWTKFTGSDSRTYFAPPGTGHTYAEAYLGANSMTAAVADTFDFRVRPLKAIDDAYGFTSLPPTSVVSAQYDGLAQENFDLVKALKQAHVPCNHVHIANAPHGFMTFPGFAGYAPAVRRVLDAFEITLKRLQYHHPETTLV